MGERGERDVVIAGGGIGGLASALCLSQAGITSRILERRSIASEDGAGIQIGPNGTRVLRGLGLLNRLEPFAGVPHNIIVRRGADGCEIGRLSLGAWMSARHGAPYWVVHRVDLHKVLFEAALADPSIDIDMDCEVAGVDASGAGVVARLAYGRQAGGQVLIGADGIWSRVRAHVLRGASAGGADFEDAVSSAGRPPKFFGKSAARTVIPVADVGADISCGDVTVWMHAEGHLVHYPIRAGQEIAVVAIVDDDTARDKWGSDVPLSWLQERTGGFDPRAKALIGAGGGNWRVWGLHVFPQLARWTRGRVALLGDAAHPILPFLAQGGVMALEDAEVLAGCLAGKLGGGQLGNDAAISNALSGYERARKSRVLRVQARSARQGRIYHMSGVGAWARDLVLRTASGDRVMAGYDWLYGWRG